MKNYILPLKAKMETLEQRLAQWQEIAEILSWMAIWVQHHQQDIVRILFIM